MEKFDDLINTIREIATTHPPSYEIMSPEALRELIRIGTEEQEVPSEKTNS